MTSASTICWSTSAGPSDRSVSSAGPRAGHRAGGADRRGGGARARRAGAGRPAWAWPLEVSGGASVACLMSFSASFLPPLTSAPTSSLASPTLPEPLKSSASSRFLGAAASIAFLTAAMNALRSKTPGCCLPISSTWAPCGLAGDLVAGRLGGGLGGGGARGGGLMGLGLRPCGPGLALHGLEVRVVPRARAWARPPQARRPRRRRRPKPRRERPRRRRAACCWAGAAAAPATAAWRRRAARRGAAPAVQLRPPRRRPWRSPPSRPAAFGRARGGTRAARCGARGAGTRAERGCARGTGDCPDRPGRRARRDRHALRDVLPQEPLEHPGHPVGRRTGRAGRRPPAARRHTPSPLRCAGRAARGRPATPSCAAWSAAVPRTIASNAPSTPSGARHLPRAVARPVPARGRRGVAERAAEVGVPHARLGRCLRPPGRAAAARAARRACP